MTEFEQLIYNKHLAVYKKHQNKPFKFRKNFDNIDEITQTTLLKLSNFFSQHKNINIDTFLKAPYDIYPDTVKFDLKFYTSLKAVKVYKQYIAKLTKQDVNSPNTINHYLESIKFVLKYCKEHNISFNDYISYKKNGYVNVFFEHLMHGDVSIYLLLMFSEFDKQLNSVDYEMRKYLIGDLYEHLDKNRAKFYSAEENTKKYFKKLFNMCEKVEKNS